MRSFEKLGVVLSLDIVEVLWILNILPSEKLPETASELLIAGYDCQALRLIAGMTSKELTDAPSLFDQAMRELNRHLLSKREAAILYTKFVSNEIVNSETSPYDGAKKIWNISIGLVPALHEIDPFIYAASEYEERPDDRNFFDSEIVKEARRWVDNK